MTQSKKPMVYLVGAGPGDPALITVRGLKLLERAEVVVYDYLASRKLLKHVPASAELIYVGKRGNVHHAHTQDEINQMLVDRARAGRMVVRLKGGDPFIFGRGGEEIQQLVAAGIPFEVVPGVTSATAAATYAGIPITHRQYTASVAFITGHEDPTKPNSNIAWDKIATGIGTIVIYMGIKNLPAICERLIRYGRDPKTPVAVVRWASTSEQQTVVGTLETITDVVSAAGIKPPSIVVVGEVVNLRDTINWYEKRPLFGKRVVVTRTREQASELVEQLEELGADCLEFPTIAIEPPEDPAPLDLEISRIHEYDWLLFTSINAVRYFFRRLQELGRDSRALAGIQVGVVGRATAEALAAHGISADFMPEEFTGDGLAESLVARGVNGLKFLIPRAAKARDILPDSLVAAGAEVTVVPVYRNVLPASPEGRKASDELRRDLAKGRIDLVTFTSSSTVTNFLKMLGIEEPAESDAILKNAAVAAIGPVTARTAAQKGLTVQIQPDAYTIPAMVDSIVAYFAQSPGK